MDTGEWSIDEIGIYTRLLLSEWCNGDLPTEPTRLARIAGCDPKRFKNRWLVVRTKFQLNGNGRYINLRMEEEREKQRKYRELQSQKGKVSAEKRLTTVDTTVEPVLQPQGQPEGNSSVFSLQSFISGSNNKGESSSKAIYSANTENFVLPSQEETQNFSELKLDDEIEKVCQKLYQNKTFPEVFAFKNTMSKNKKSKRALLHTLGRCYLTKPKDPWPFCVQVMKVENGNYNEQEFLKDH